MEYFDVLDETGRKTGEVKSRVEVHLGGDWHRSVHVWIVNDAGEILLQKRSLNKESSAGMWDISSAGHLSAGDESLDGAVREIFEELGVEVDPSALRFLGTLKHAGVRRRPDYFNNELSDIYLLRLNLDVDRLQLQEEEVSAVRYVSLPAFREMVDRKDPSLVERPREFEILFAALEESGV